MPKKRIWASANAVIEAISTDSTTVASAMKSEFHSERNSVGPKMISSEADRIPALRQAERIGRAARRSL